MKLFLRNIILLLFMSHCCHLPLLMAQEGLRYGLKFNSHETVQENRTGLNLTPDGKLSFVNGFTISFDVKFHPDVDYRFGYVFRIIGEDEQNFDMLLNEKGHYSQTLSFTYSDEILYDCLFNHANIVFNEWIPVKIEVDILNNQLMINCGDEKQFKQSVDLSKFKHVNISFGKCDVPKFRVTDIPAMSLKELKISDNKGKSSYHWKLSKHTDQGVFDELHHHFALTNFPVWILDQHAFWKKQFVFTVSDRSQIFYNSDEHLTMAISKQDISTYDIVSNKLKTEAIHSEFATIFPNQTIYNPTDSTYYYYSYDLLNRIGKEIAVYDTLRRTWSDIVSYPNYKLTNDCWHHNKYLSTEENKLYLFGGYGHHQYKNDIIIYDFNTKTWTKKQYTGDVISPRYLSGLGKIDEKHLLIFGGYGSKTGNQELSPQFYYDAYIVDIETMESKKLWVLNGVPDTNFLSANSIVVDTVGQCFYALCFPSEKYSTSLSLYKFSLQKPEYEVLADSIPYIFRDTKSYADLSYDKLTGKLVAVTFSPEIIDSTAIVSIYTLSYPPLAAQDLYQIEKISDNKWLFVLIGCCLLGCFLFVFMLKKRKKETQKSLIIDETDDMSSDESIINVKPVSKKLTKQSIYLFGGFQLVDKEEKDIAGNLAPILKQLFLIILLHTLKDGKGISSVKLKETLWFDKSDKSANNNRGVSLSKLRQIFEQVGDIQIKQDNIYWTVEFGDDIYCDYYKAIGLMQLFKDKKNRNIKDLKRLIFIVSAGEMLPNLQVSWVDPFKADFANDLIDLFMDIAKTNDLNLIPQIRIDLANAIFIHDSLNEDALRLKCSVLFEMGKNGLAKNVYKSFVKEYRIAFGSDYKYSFEQIIDNSAIN